MEGHKQENCQILFCREKICFDSREEFPIHGINIFRHGIPKKHQMKFCAEMDLKADFESIQFIEEVNIRCIIFN